jgi:hypothetical protein
MRASVSVNRWSAAWWYRVLFSPTVPRLHKALFCYPRIELTGANLLSPLAKERLVAPWLNQCLDIAGLNALTNTVSDWYISRGYITSRAFLTEQDLSGGVLHLAVLEGASAHSPRRCTGPHIEMTFPGLRGRSLICAISNRAWNSSTGYVSGPLRLKFCPATGRATRWLI